MNHAFKIKNSAATTKAKASVSTLIHLHNIMVTELTISRS